MTDTDKDKINRVIAGAMGLELRVQSVPISPTKAKVKKVYVRPSNREEIFDPYDDISDAFEAVDVIADGKYYSIEIKHMPFSKEHARFGTFLKIERGSRIIKTIEFAETPQAALSLAIRQFLEVK